MFLALRNIFAKRASKRAHVAAQSVQPTSTLPTNHPSPPTGDASTTPTDDASTAEGDPSPPQAQGPFDVREPLIRYSYQPLPSKDRIRLLHLDPSDDRTAPITITISEHRLSEAPTYDALSYAWGDVDDMHDIVALDGSTARRVLPVTKNCHSALRRLRLPDSQRALWVDAVCINQDDISERNAQVALMGGIYRDATRVVVDVGETSDSSDAAIDFIARYSRDPGTGTILFNMTGGLGIRSAIGDFYRRPWFTRVWVLQEVFMARRETAQLLCGDRLVDWAVFRPFKIWVDSRPAWETEHWHVALPTLVPQSLVIGNRHGRQHSGGQDFLALLCKVRSCLSTDPRDKVFALLSMFDFGPDDKDRIVADYGKSAAQVYVEAAAWLLPRVGLAFLSCVTRGSQRIESLPSWVPDWTERYLECWLIGLSDVYYPLRAGTESEPVAEIVAPADGKDSQLSVRGVVVDSIRMASKSINIRSTEGAELDAFLAACRDYRRQLDATAAGAARLPKARYWEPKTSERRIHPPNWAAYTYGLPVKTPSAHSDNDMCDYMSFLTVGRQLVITEKGYVGVVPTEADVGDVVCCFLGARVPFVLREAAANEFTLLGESYVYGLMDGEAFEGVDMARAAEEGHPLRDILIS